MNWSATEERALKILINEQIDTRLLQHLQVEHSPQMISGGHLQDVKPEGNTTTLTPEMATTVFSNSLLALGDRLGELDYLISTLTTLRDNMQYSYRNVLDGVNGRNADASLD